MAAKILISYDGTDNDHDALVLGRALAASGGELSLAYVTHSAPSEGEQTQAEEMLRKGALALDQPEASRHVVLNASTPDGLRDLAAREGADIVVFGSEYRTAAGSVSAGTSAQRLLNGAPFAVAIAPAELRAREDFAVGRVGVLAEAGDQAPGETARRLAAVLGATVIEPGNGSVDLLVVGSRSGSPAGTLQLSATAEYAIETASSPVLALPRDQVATVGATPAAAGTDA